jgi:two-component system CheB/CheR fusion protein
MKKQITTVSGVNNRAKAALKEPLLPQSFPIVALGASAGGLEALAQFPRNVPEESVLAFVIIQHLDPSHKGIMLKLLQRTTGMEVFQVMKREKVKPNCVYVILQQGHVNSARGAALVRATAPCGLRLPLDFFSRSLAEDRKEHSIGVIHSDIGSDGDMGLMAIKEKVGLVLVQEPASAKFDSMPRSGIAAGLADLVASVKDLPGKILDFLHHASILLLGVSIVI